MVSTSTPDIAIVGMACRVAGANSPSQLWEVFETSKDVRSVITRFNSAGFYKPDVGPRKGLTNVRHAYVMPDGVDKFDNTFFKIAPMEAEAMDPQQRLLLEITYEAIENAGISLDGFEGSDISVYAAFYAIAANRISYVFNLHGPSLVIDTACSSAMVALHQAIAGLKAGESNMTVVCGANPIITPDMYVHMSELGFISPSGMCRSFDASGDGYARGEGVMAIILKPLEDALRNGDPVRAVIRGTRINQDGRTNGISLPSSVAQRQNVEALYIGVEAPSDDEARYCVLSAFSMWNFLDIPCQVLEKLHVYHGDLSHSSLGLPESTVQLLNEKTDTIYHFDSDVSLLKNYEGLQKTNIGSLNFLIDLARGAQSGKVKAVHYLSSWGVSHLQSWTSTKLDERGCLDGEYELN